MSGMPPVAAPVNGLEMNNDLLLLRHAFEKTHAGNKTDSIQQCCSSFVHVSISFESKEQKDIESYILVDSNVPLPQHSDEEQTLAKNINAYFFVESILKNHSGLDKHREKLWWKNCERKEAYAKSKKQRLEDIEQYREAIVRKGLKEYMLGKEFGTQLISIITKAEDESKKLVLADYVDASIRFVLKPMGKRCGYETFDFQKIEISIHIPDKYDYTFEKGEESNKFFDAVLSEGDFYRVFGLAEKNSEIQGRVSFGSSLILDALAYYENGISNAFSDHEWLEDANKSLTLESATGQNKNAAVLMRFESLRICKTVELYLRNKLDSENMFFTAENKNSISLSSIDPEKHKDKSVVSVFGLKQSEKPSYSFHCFIFDPSFGKHTSSFVNGIKEYLSSSANKSFIRPSVTFLLPSEKRVERPDSGPVVVNKEKSSKFYWICGSLFVLALLIIGLSFYFNLDAAGK